MLLRTRVKCRPYARLALYHPTHVCVRTGMAPLVFKAVTEDLGRFGGSAMMTEGMACDGTNLTTLHECIAVQVRQLIGLCWLTSRGNRNSVRALLPHFEPAHLAAGSWSSFSVGVFWVRRCSVHQIFGL